VKERFGLEVVKVGVALGFHDQSFVFVPAGGVGASAGIVAATGTVAEIAPATAVSISSSIRKPQRGSGHTRALPARRCSSQQDGAETASTWATTSASPTPHVTPQNTVTTASIYQAVDQQGTHAVIKRRQRSGDPHIHPRDLAERIHPVAPDRWV